MRFDGTESIEARVGMADLASFVGREAWQASPGLDCSGDHELAG